MKTRIVVHIALNAKNERIGELESLIFECSTIGVCK